MDTTVLRQQTAACVHDRHRVGVRHLHAVHSEGRGKTAEENNTRKRAKYFFLKFALHRILGVLWVLFFPSGAVFVQFEVCVCRVSVGIVGV